MVTKQFGSRSQIIHATGPSGIIDGARIGLSAAVTYSRGTVAEQVPFDTVLYDSGGYAGTLPVLHVPRDGIYTMKALVIASSAVPYTALLAIQNQDAIGVAFARYDHTTGGPIADHGLLCVFEGALIGGDDMEAFYTSDGPGGAGPDVGYRGDGGLFALAMSIRYLGPTPA